MSHRHPCIGIISWRVGNRIRPSLRRRTFNDQSFSVWKRNGEVRVFCLGGIHQASHGGKRGTTDVSAAALYTLIDVYENIVVRWPAGLMVQLHFDYDDQDVSIRSRRNGSAAVTVALRHPQNLLIRVPGCAPPKSVAFEAAGQPVTPVWLGSFAFFGGQQISGPITLAYDLPRSTTEEDIDATHYTFQWRVDEILGISPNTDYLPFYAMG